MNETRFVIEYHMEYGSMIHRLVHSETEAEQCLEAVYQNNTGGCIRWSENSSKEMKENGVVSDVTFVVPKSHVRAVRMYEQVVPQKAEEDKE